ncbi:FAD-dependent monooxygenase [Bacillus cereus group sp. Bc256]|uniref:FAD-dependent oxidoreductase n=1 Tax=unclassified Bacillus cereus group TaxID=2750818 RepID=UPI001F560ABC|nr:MULTISPECIES: FAD-dependent monooxygenase [unclassified Bacillus cereus group]MDA2139078.1 FAD-dependent monooxygenase [Bacillus cereus group sp. Bc256]MDA2598472.1 FAD-dependent monooxygenase [Bacillus cereus group sp. Bc061]
MNKLTVAIIGGGLGGLALAQSLKKNNIDFGVYEREQCSSFRQTGYRIKLNPDGTKALRNCLPTHLYELHLATSVFTTSHPVFLDAYSLKQDKESGGPDGTREVSKEVQAAVNRFTFREVLLGELEENVHWGYRFTHYETLGNGKIRAWFDNGEHVDADVLVGADGGASKVRTQYKPNVKIFDTGGRVLYTKIFLDEHRREELKLLTGGEMRGIGSPDGEAPASLLLDDMAFKQPLEKAPESLALQVKITPQQDYLYAVFAGSPEWFDIPDEQLFKLSGSELLQLAQERTRNWHPQVKRMLELAEPELTAVYHLRNVLPFKPWKETTQVVLLGDALHPMTPAGSGANSALFDANELSKELVHVKNGNKQLFDALRDYELPAIQRGMKSVRLSAQAGEHMFNQNPLPKEDMVIEE